jgi:hypothetical protein
MTSCSLVGLWVQLAQEEDTNPFVCSNVFLTSAVEMLPLFLARIINYL